MYKKLEDLDPRDRVALMPVLTPMFPAANINSNVTLVTRNVIITELEKAMKITKHIMSKPETNKVLWNRLFKPFPFFKAYPFYVQIQILSRNQEVHDKWKGYCEMMVK
jgi:poly(A) polymerase